MTQSKMTFLLERLQTLQNLVTGRMPMYLSQRW